MKKILKSASILALIVLLFSSCAKTEEEKITDSITKFTVAFYKADADKAVKYCTEGSADGIVFVMSFIDENVKKEMKQTKPQVEVTEIIISEDGLTAESSCVLKDIYDPLENTLKEETTKHFSLSKEGNKWLVN